MESITGISGRAAVILGAGASRAEAMARPREVMPPLDADFFQQLQALRDMTPSACRTLEVAREIFGSEPSATMEEFFTQIEFFVELTRLGTPAESQRARDLEPGIRYAKAPEDFREALLGLLREADVAEESRSGFAPPCDLHQRLAQVLRPGDAIITFNYDTLVDYSLREIKSGQWDFLIPVGGDTGYWKVMEGGITSGANEGERSHDCPAIHVHKMHGSINWMIANDRVQLVKPPFKAGSMGIIPPAWHKPVAQSRVFSAVWANARSALEQADVLIIAGYSVPRTDMLAQAMLRATAAQRVDRPLTHVILANPDQPMVKALIGMIAPAIGPHTQIRRFPGFGKLAHFVHPF